MLNREQNIFKNKMDSKICSKCKKEKVLDEYKQKPNGDFNKMCIRCCEIVMKSENKNKCSHNRRRTRCHECNGSSICQHNSTHI